MNPKQYDLYRKAYLEKEKSKLKQADMLNHLLGKYVAYAVNEPKKYPDNPFLTPAQFDENAEMTDEQMERVGMRNTIILGGKIDT